MIQTIFLYAYGISVILCFCYCLNEMRSNTRITLLDLVSPLFISGVPLVNTLLGLIWVADRLDKIVVYKKT